MIKRNIRLLTQITMLIFFLIVVLFLPHYSLQGICPVSSVSALYIFLTSGTMISFATISVLLISIIFGSVFCGWVCPLGTFQDIISCNTKNIKLKILNKTSLKEQNNDKNKIITYLPFIRYITLICIILFSIFNIMFLIRSFCTYHTTLNVFLGFITYSGLILIILIGLLSVFTERPWCRFLCPYGALLGFTNKIRIFKLTRNKDKCIDCKLCDKNCPVKIKVSTQTTINSNQCISCFKCTSENNCPVKNVVSLNFKLKQKKFFSQIYLPISILSIFIISIPIYNLLNCYSEKIITTHIAENNMESKKTNDEIPSYQGKVKEKIDTHDQKSITEKDEVQESVQDGIQDGVQDDIQDKKVQDAQEEIYKDGIFEGVGFGYRAGLRVSVEIKNNKIVDIKIISHNESPGFFEMPFDIIPDNIIQNQSTKVDTISGATATSNGIQQAVNNALKKAKINGVQ